MPFITSIERFGLCKGMRRGLEAVLRVRFGGEGLQLMPQIREIYEEDKLEAIFKALETGASLEEVRRLSSPPPAP